MSLIYFPQLPAGLLPTSLPVLFVGLLLAGRSGLEKLSKDTPSSAVITKEFRPLDYYYQDPPGQGGQVCMQGEEERLRNVANGAFASLRCALQLQASHSNSWASISSSFKWVCTIRLGGSWSPLHLDFDLPACLLWALLTLCHDNGWANH